MNVRRGKWSASCAAVVSAAALLCAAPASADQMGDAFVAALANNGIAFPDRGNAIAMGHSGVRRI
jgi:hypothetical protein